MKGRRPGWRTAPVAVALWFVLAVVVWNVTFDRIIVEAGRAYIRAARVSARLAAPLARASMIDTHSARRARRAGRRKGR